MLTNVCLLRILIREDKLLPFSNYRVQIYNFFQKFVAHLKPYDGTPVVEHCSKVMPSISETLCICMCVCVCV
jgi:hypothetical protein